MRLIRLLIVLICIFSSSVLYAATYYIDYSAGADANNGLSTATPWKHHPYMSAFSGSYSHSNGDVFVFKGGVTWPTKPIVVQNSGGAGNPDIYMSGHRCGQSGSNSCNSGVAWGSGQAILSGSCTGSCATGTAQAVYIRAHENLTFDGLSFPSIGFDQKVIDILGTLGGITVKYCNFEQGITGISISTVSTESNASGVELHHNTFKDLANGIYIIGHYTTYTLDDVNIHNNVFQGIGPGYSSGGYHPDGIQISGNHEWSISNLKIENNQFRGVWNTVSTSMIYLQWVNGAIIRNNLFAPESTDNVGILYSPGAITLGSTESSQHNANIKIQNNTWAADANYASNQGMTKCFASFFNNGDVEITNNIFSRCEISISSQTTINCNAARYAYIKYDGGATTEITLPTGYKTLDQVASALQTAINGVFGISCTVEHNAGSNQSFSLTAPSGHTFSFSLSEANALATANGRGSSARIMPLLGFTSDVSAAQTITAPAKMMETNYIIDYNDFYVRTGGHIVQSYGNNYDTVGSSATQCTSYGWNCNSVIGAPSFITTPTGTLNSGDFHLQAPSAAIAHGQNLYSSFTTDIAGLTRQTSPTAWDIGAYGYDLSGGEVTPEPSCADTPSLCANESACVAAGWHYCSGICQATLCPVYYTVTPSAGAGGSVSPTTAQSVLSGGSVQVVVSPNRGFSASVGGTCNSSCVNNICTVTPVADCTISATFTALPVQSFSGKKGGT